MIRILLLTDSIDSKLSIDIYFILFSVCEETMMEKKAALENYPIQCDELVDINERNYTTQCGSMKKSINYYYYFTYSINSVLNSTKYYNYIVWSIFVVVVALATFNVLIVFNIVILTELMDLNVVFFASEGI